jgi:hypothetical protein
MALRRTPWNDVRVKQLRQLLTAGLHDRAIADRMGFEYSAVMKKRQRLGWAGNPSPSVPGRRSLTDARAENAQPWDPPPGMTKVRCTRCRFWFAAPSDRRVKHCPDCQAASPRPEG